MVGRRLPVPLLLCPLSIHSLAGGHRRGLGVDRSGEADGRGGQAVTGGGCGVWRERRRGGDQHQAAVRIAKGGDKGIPNAPAGRHANTRSRPQHNATPAPTFSRTRSQSTRPVTSWERLPPATPPLLQASTPDAYTHEMRRARRAEAGEGPHRPREERRGQKLKRGTVGGGALRPHHHSHGLWWGGTSSKQAVNHFNGLSVRRGGVTRTVWPGGGGTKRPHAGVADKKMCCGRGEGHTTHARLTQRVSDQTTRTSSSSHTCRMSLKGAGSSS